MTRKELLFRVKSSNPDHRSSNHRTTIYCLGSAGVYFSLGPTAERLSLIKLGGFCSAFPITSSTVSSQRAQKYFAESSSCKVEMVRLEDLRDLSEFIEWWPSLLRKLISPLGRCLYQKMLYLLWLASYRQFRVTDSPTRLGMSGGSWITFWATPDPVGKIRKQRWNNE